MTAAAARFGRLGGVWQRAQPVVASTWFVGVVVTVAAWNVAFSSPFAGLDPSWVTGLYIAAHDGLHFGSQVIWTYGPLGFLAQPSITYPSLGVISFLYGAALLVALCVSLVWTVRRVVNLAIAAAVVYLTVGAFPLPPYTLPLVVAAVWCLAVLAPTPAGYARHVVALGGGVLGAIECLVKLSVGPTILLMCALALLALPTRARDLLRLAITAVLTATVLWFATGQGVGNVPDYVGSARQLIGGYSQAMGIDQQPHWYIYAAIEIGLMLVVWSAVAAGPGIRRALAGGVMALAVFSIFKEGFVRFDSEHVVAFFATAAALALAVPWRRALIPAGAVTFLLAAGLAVDVTGVTAGQVVNPVPRVNRLWSGLRLAASSGRQDAAVAAARGNLTSAYRLDPGTVALLRGHRVDVWPWEAAVAWGYRLDWNPEPVFQGYQAYTSALDRDNADFLASAPAGQRILRSNPAAIGEGSPVDGRNQSWDPPLAMVAMLCHYAPLRTTARWQVLGKVGDRCGELRRIRSVDTAYGRSVVVPKAPPGAAVVAKLHGVGVGGLESVRAFFFRADARYATVNGASTYRLVPGTAADGLLMSVPRRADFPGASFSLSPGARKLSLSGRSGDLRIDFYALPIRSWRWAGR